MYMEGEKFPNTQEKNPKMVVAAPATESLLEVSAEGSLWPEYIKENEQLKREAEIRKNSLKSLEEITQNIPVDLEITKAMEKGDVSPESLIGAYKNLTELLQSDLCNDRLILYFSFELIPPKNWKSDNKELAESAENFLRVYMDKWRDLLNVSDVRENFVEGDVLESELRDEPLERVVKAAHLIPKLMEKGILSVQEVVMLIENHPGTNLEKSAVDVLPVLVDMGLMTQSELGHIVEKYNLDLNYRKTKAVPEDKITEARAKWLEDKDKPVTMIENSAELIDKSFNERERLIKNDIEVVRQAVESIQSNPELSKLIYPACILFGSKIKGYGAIDADVDLAVFVRPEISAEERDYLKAQLSQTFSHDKIKGKVVEFWLEDRGDEFGILDFENLDSTLADSSWAHVLFEGSWVGDEDAIKELYEKLLSGFLYSKDKKIFGGDARTIWLEEMEKDTLQYRLMHKGYTRLFPRQGGIQTKHSDRIDGQSTFYDSGYRRLATKLYLSKVFLPQLEKSN